MKKFVTVLMMLTMLVLMLPLAATEVSAQKRYTVTRNGRTTIARRNPSFYRRNRNLINIAAGTGAGALIGGLAGGKKGALIGTAVGAGGSALYTYKIRPKKRRYRRIR